MQKTITLTRGGLGAFFSLIGFGGIVSAAVLLIWGGFSTLVIAALIVGLIGMIAWWRLVPDDFRAFISGRSVRYGTATIFTTVLLVGIIVMGYLLIARAAVTWDLTISQRFSLTQTSLNVIQRVNRPIQISGFYTARAAGLREIDDQYWRLYETASDGMIRRQYYDPEEVPALAQQFGVTEDAQVFLSYLNDDGTIDYSLVARVFLTDQQESDMTLAISRLLVAGTLTVYFSTGFGERSPTDDTQEGISFINNGMRESGLVTLPLDIGALAAQGGDIPEDASALVFARPLRDLTSDEVAVIARYMDRGGSLLLLSDVLFNRIPFMDQGGEFNNWLWQNYGLRALNAAVIDFVTGQTTPLEIIGAAIYDETDFSENLDPATNPVLFRIARAIDVNLSIENTDISNGRLIRSSEQSYGETDLTTLGETNTYEIDETTDVPGPLILAAWAWNQRNDSRVFLIGDSDFASNGQVANVVGNGILFTNAMNWLSHLQDEVEFGAQGFSTGVPMFYSRDQLDTITFFVVFLIPTAVLIAGAAIWARRVRR